MQAARLHAAQHTGGEAAQPGQAVDPAGELVASLLEGRDVSAPRVAESPVSLVEAVLV